SQAPAVVLAAAVVAALDRVLGVEVGRVVVQLLTTGGVHTTLRSNGVRAAWGIVVGEDLHVVAQLAEGCGGSATGQAGTDDQDAELVAVQRGHQAEVVLGVGPLLILADLVRGVVLQDLADGHAVDGGLRRGESCDCLVVIEIRSLVVRVVNNIAHSRLLLNRLASLNAWDEWHLLNAPEQHSQWDRDIADEDQGRDQVGDPQDHLAPAVAGNSQVRGRGPDAVRQVGEQDEHRDDVDDRNCRALEGGHEVLVGGGVAVNSLGEVAGRGRLDTQGQVQDMEDDEQQQHDAGHRHGACGEGIPVADHALAAEAAAGLVAAADQCERKPHVQHDCHEQHDAEDPQHAALRQDRRTDLAEEVRVSIEALSAGVNLQVSEHVDQNKQAEDDASDGHRQLHNPGWDARLFAQGFRRYFPVDKGVPVFVILYSHGTSSVVITLRAWRPWSLTAMVHPGVLHPIWGKITGSTPIVQHLRCVNAPESHQSHQPHNSPPRRLRKPPGRREESKSSTP